MVKDGPAVKTSGILIFFLLIRTSLGFSEVVIPLLGYTHGEKMQLDAVVREMTARTSLEIAPKPQLITIDQLREPLVWTNQIQHFLTPQKNFKAPIVRWLIGGGLLVVEGDESLEALKKWTEFFPLIGCQGPQCGKNTQKQGWYVIGNDHELFRSFYLLESLPRCRENPWRAYHYDGRTAIILMTWPLLSSVSSDGALPKTVSCARTEDAEFLTRTFINTLMAVLATDYKLDQIHLPEILKRLK